MTDSGQSRKEAAVMTTGAVGAKTTTLIGFWNVRTMYEQGKVAQVIAEMKRYKLDILGVSESRWTKCGRMKTTTGETVLYYDISRLQDQRTKNAFFLQLRNRFQALSLDEVLDEINSGSK